MSRTGCERSVLSNTRRHSARMTSMPNCCPHLTADDLKEIGVTSVGHRRRLLEAIAALRLEGTPTADPVRLRRAQPRPRTRLV